MRPPTLIPEASRLHPSSLRNRTYSRIIHPRARSFQSDSFRSHGSMVYYNILHVFTSCMCFVPSSGGLASSVCLSLPMLASVVPSIGLDIAALVACRAWFIASYRRTSVAPRSTPHYSGGVCAKPSQQSPGGDDLDMPPRTPLDTQFDRLTGLNLLARACSFELP